MTLCPTCGFTLDGPLHRDGCSAAAPAAMPDWMFRQLTPDEEVTFRQWARENWHAGKPVNPTWHPVVREECDLIRDEAEAAEAARKETPR